VLPIIVKLRMHEFLALHYIVVLATFGISDSKTHYICLKSLILSSKTCSMNFFVK
ncbi:uncharacterized protein A4U43_C10F19160, partial [Asparagus officinalis]